VQIGGGGHEPTKGRRMAFLIVSLHDLLSPLRLPMGDDDARFGVSTSCYFRFAGYLVRRPGGSSSSINWTRLSFHAVSQRPSFEPSCTTDLASSWPDVPSRGARIYGLQVSLLPSFAQPSPWRGGAGATRVGEGKLGRRAGRHDIMRDISRAPVPAPEVCRRTVRRGIYSLNCLERDLKNILSSPMCCLSLVLSEVE